MGHILEISQIKGYKTPIYNPKDVDVTSQNYPIDFLVERIRNNEINFNHGFQRQKNWSNEQQSLFIESILIRLPSPSFFFDGSQDNNWLIVDGFQRILTLKNFIVDANLKLTGLEYLPQYEGYTFGDLPRDLQRRIFETVVAVYLINPGTPDLVKYSIFERINTGGTTLSPQEIRTALYYGVATDFIDELAELSLFKTLTVGSFSKKRMEDKEAVIRCLSFILNKIDDYHSDMDKWMNKAMEKLKHSTSTERENIKINFDMAMQIAEKIGGDDAFRKSSDKLTKRKSINMALFETWITLLSKLNHQEIDKIILNKNIVKEQFNQVLKEDEAFVKSIRSNANDFVDVKKRFQTIDNIIQKAIL